MKSKDIRYIKGVGEKRAEAYHRLGIDSPDALLRYYPRSYINPGKITPVLNLLGGETASIRVVINKNSLKTAKLRGRNSIVKFSAFDETGKIAVTYFNNPYTPETLKHGEEYVLYGRVSRNLYGAEITNPLVFQKNIKPELKPIYTASGLLSSKTIEKNIKTVLEEIEIKDPLPENVLSENGLISLSDALKIIHSPKDENQLSLAKERLVFDELFYFQLGLIKLKSLGRKETNIKIAENFSPERFYKTLPFTPTNAQKKAVNEALIDMKKGVLMNRLLQGDVGSGKTLVAAALMLSIVESGYQAVLMAPTEILAAQHYNTLKNLMGKEKNIVLINGSKTAKEKREVKELISSGKADIIIGTHAVIQKDVEFYNLGLVITDEQHRFGVAQRSELINKGEGVHCLVMSATPIPRTLALVIYSDLDISVLDEIPSGRKPIDTLKIDSSIRERALRFIKKNCMEGRNAYIVCPLIEEGAEGLLSVEEYLELLKNSPVKDIPFAVLHGKMKAKDKDLVMERFKMGEIKLLISTTVVEVGVDVPNANIMMIENAERFGLSQLHQLRGRVGRGEYKSYCILVSDAKGHSEERLNALCNISDGFKIAEYDLKTRGPGDFLGNMQHGLPEFKIADMAGDMRIVKKARAAAANLLKNDLSLEKEENKALKEEVNRLFKDKTEKIYL